MANHVDRTSAPWLGARGRGVALSLLALVACSKGTDTSNGGGDSTATGIDGGGGGGGGGEGGPMPAPFPVGGDSGVSYTCARSIHVATNGDDGNAGSAAAPLKTIAKATPTAQPGDCVLVHAGTYSESSTIGFKGDGSATAPIVLWSVDGRGAAIIDAGSNRSGPTVLIHQDYVIVDGFDFRNSPTDTSEQVVHFDGLTMGKGVGSVLRNCKLTGGYDHLKINQTCRGVTIEYNEFYGNFGHLPISLTSAPGLVFRHNFGHDWSTGDNGAIQLKGGSQDVLFDGNLFQDVTSQAGTIAMGDGCDTTCDIDPEHYAAVRARAINNVMVRVGRGFDVQGCKDCAVLSNTIVDSGQSNVVFKLTSAATNGVTHDSVNVRIQDNLVANSKGDQGDVIQINATAGQGLQMDYNLVWNGGGAVSWGDTHPAGADTHSLTKDPRLVAPASGDFKLNAGSAAIGAGLNLFADVAHDFSGATRPASGPFDIGAFQSP